MNAYQANTNLTSQGPLSYVLGTGIIPQLLLTLALATTLYILMMSLELVYKSFVAVKGTFVPLLPFTCSAEDKPRQFEQNPNVKDAVHIPLSDNERSGAEFSYAFFLWVNPTSFKQEDGLLHIMHKGHPTPYPLLGPGIFLRSNVNTLRVYMNNSKTWNNYVEVENIPVKKWVHVVVLARDNSVEVYINGNLSKKLNSDGAVLYQNFGNLYLFSQRPVVLNPMQIPSLGGNILQIYGTYSGNMSNLFYYNYALSYTEIQSLVNEGPSRKTEASGMDAPPYLQDSWWVSDYSK
jgi:hypothetical protein